MKRLTSILVVLVVIGVVATPLASAWNVRRVRFVPTIDEVHDGNDSYYELDVDLDLRNQYAHTEHDFRTIDSVEFKFVHRESGETLDSYEFTREQSGDYEDDFPHDGISGNFRFRVTPSFGFPYDEGFFGNVVFSGEHFDVGGSPCYHYSLRVTVFLIDEDDEITTYSFTEIYTEDYGDLTDGLRTGVFADEIMSLSSYIVGLGSAIAALALVILLYQLQFHTATGDVETIKQHKQDIMRWVLGLFIIGTSLLLMGVLTGAM